MSKNPFIPQDSTQNDTFASQHHSTQDSFAVTNNNTHPTEYTQKSDELADINNHLEGNLIISKAPSHNELPGTNKLEETEQQALTIKHIKEVQNQLKKSSNLKAPGSLLSHNVGLARSPLTLKQKNDHPQKLTPEPNTLNQNNENAPQRATEKSTPKIALPTKLSSANTKNATKNISNQKSIDSKIGSPIYTDGKNDPTRTKQNTQAQHLNDNHIDELFANSTRHSHENSTFSAPLNTREPIQNTKNSEKKHPISHIVSTIDNLLTNSDDFPNPAKSQAQQHEQHEQLGLNLGTESSYIENNIDEQTQSIQNLDEPQSYLVDSSFYNSIDEHNESKPNSTDDDFYNAPHPTENDIQSEQIGDDRSTLISVHNKNKHFLQFDEDDDTVASNNEQSKQKRSKTQLPGSSTIGSNNNSNTARQAINTMQKNINGALNSAFTFLNSFIKKAKNSKSTSLPPKSAHKTNQDKTKSIKVHAGNQKLKESLINKDIIKENASASASASKHSEYKVPTSSEATTGALKRKKTNNTKQIKSNNSVAQTIIKKHQKTFFAIGILSALIGSAGAYFFYLNYLIERSSPEYIAALINKEIEKNPNADISKLVAQYQNDYISTTDDTTTNTTTSIQLLTDTSIKCKENIKKKYQAAFFQIDPKNQQQFNQHNAQSNFELAMCLYKPIENKNEVFPFDYLFDTASALSIAIASAQFAQINTEALLGAKNQLLALLEKSNSIIINELKAPYQKQIKECQKPGAMILCRYKFMLTDDKILIGGKAWEVLEPQMNKYNKILWQLNNAEAFYEYLTQYREAIIQNSPLPKEPWTLKS